MYYLYVKLKPMMGFASRIQPQSKMRVSYKYPPPTTLLGALAYPWTRITNGRLEVVKEGKKYLSMAESIRLLIKGVAGHFTGPAFIYGSYLRINLLYRGEARFGVTALPMTLFYSDRDSYLEAIYIVNKIDDELLRAAWGITRVGSRESIFYTEYVKWGVAEEKQETSVQTRFSFWLNNELEIHGKGNIIYCVDWRESSIGDYSTAIRKPYFYPYNLVRVSAKKGVLHTYIVETERGKETVVNT